MNPPLLRAPTEQYGLLVVPPLGEVDSLLERNTALSNASSVYILQRPLAEVRALAQSEIHAAASKFMARLELPLVEQSGKGFIVTGHQPELFHPGVWIKNFAAHYFARRFGRQPLHLIVDSDLVKVTSILVPTAEGVRDTAHFDEAPVQIPYEERKVTDAATFKSFPDTVNGLTGPLPWTPILKEFWKEVIGVSATTSLLGDRLAVGRHQWETKYGCHNREVRISDICATESFAVFACDVLANLPRFHQIHNENLEAFRRRHRVRSRHHPVPPLAKIDGWSELPFWIWRTDQPRRARLFASETTEGWQLGYLDGKMRPLKSPLPRQPQQAVAAWRELADQGWKVRSRALTTTLFARLFLADLFIHGIGGGIYDELTDTIIKDYYRVEPPGFLILSGTLRLPWPEDSQSQTGPRALQQRLRNLDYHPERYLLSGDDAGELLRLEKQELRGRVPQTKLERHERFLALKRCTAAMSARLQSEKKYVEMQWEQSRSAEQQRRWRQDREYSFCLHPDHELRKLFAPFLA